MNNATTTTCQLQCQCGWQEHGTTEEIDVHLLRRAMWRHVSQTGHDAKLTTTTVERVRRHGR